MKISGLWKNKIFIGSIIIVILVVISGIMVGNMIISFSTKKDKTKSVEVTDAKTLKDNETKVVKEEVAEEKTEEVITPVVEDPIVYDNMTMTELSNKLDRSLSSDLSGKGNLFATYSLEKGIDPYLGVAIILLETGCSWNCSQLVKSCNNVGGQKGSGCGSYQSFESLDAGIMAFIDNLANNYYAYGLTTPEAMNSKYAANPNWYSDVNSYINQIRNS